MSKEGFVELLITVVTDLHVLLDMRGSGDSESGSCSHCKSR